MERYITKFTIEFAHSMSYEQETGYLDRLRFSYEVIWAHTYVVETGCGIPAQQFYTNYGTQKQTSLGDSSFVKYVNPVYYYRDWDSDFRLTGLVGVQFDRFLKYERIQKIADSLNLKFREYDPGAPQNLYWLIVPKQACCNPIGIAEILQEFDEVEIAEPAFNYTIPNPTLNQNMEKLLWNTSKSLDGKPY